MVSLFAMVGSNPPTQGCGVDAVAAASGSLEVHERHSNRCEYGGESGRHRLPAGRGREPACAAIHLGGACSRFPRNGAGIVSRLRAAATPTLRAGLRAAATPALRAGLRAAATPALRAGLCRWDTRQTADISPAGRRRARLPAAAASSRARSSSQMSNKGGGPGRLRLPAGLVPAPDPPRRCTFALARETVANPAPRWRDTRQTARLHRHFPSPALSFSADPGASEPPSQGAVVT